MQTFLKSVPFFADLSDDDLAHLAGLIAELRLPAGELLFQEGDVGNYAYIIYQGKVEIFSSNGARELSLAVRGPGDMIGEMALLDNAHRVASARARTNCDLLVIPRREFAKLLRTSPSAAYDTLYNVVPRWRRTEQTLRAREEQVREQSHKLEYALNALRRAHDELERRVEERTAELALANRILTEQIVERQRAEKELLTYREHLEDLVEERTAELETTNGKLRTLNERLQHELTTARRIQYGLLPSATPDWQGVDIVCYSVPAHEVGGDFYTYHAFPNNGIMVAVGDVSGKGMPAALLMAVSLTAFTTAVVRAQEPTRLLNSLDEQLAPYTRTTRQNCALCCAHIGSGVLRVANAGCVMPLLRRTDGSVQWVEAGGMPLGIGGTIKHEYRDVMLPIDSGDLLVLTSDGVIEATAPGGELYGFHRLEAAVADGPGASAVDMISHLRNHIMHFVNGQEPHDDMTLVVVRC